MNDIFETKVTMLNLYVGLHIERDRYAHFIFLYQRTYLEKILADYGFDSSMEIATPADSNSILRQANTAGTEFSGDFPFTNANGSF
jgi:hypothetical protein